MPDSQPTFSKNAICSNCGAKAVKMELGKPNFETVSWCENGCVCAYSINERRHKVYDFHKEEYQVMPVMNPCVICLKEVDKLYSIWDAGMPIVPCVPFCSVCLAVLKTMSKIHEPLMCANLACPNDHAMNSRFCLECMDQLRRREEEE